MKIKQYPFWANWKQQGKHKVPYSAHNRRMDVTDPAQWLTRAQAEKQQTAVVGVGIVFAKTVGVVGLDFDNCVNDQGTITDPFVQGYLESFDSYAEYSPSGRGIHILVSGTVSKSVKTSFVEIYDDKHFFTLTGDTLFGYDIDIRPAQETLDLLVEEAVSRVTQTLPIPSVHPGVETSPSNLTVEMVLRRMFNSNQGRTLFRLYNGDTLGLKSASEADIKLAGACLWYSNLDVALTREIMLGSALYRDKFVEKRGQTDYLGGTIAKALSNIGNSHPKRVPTVLEALRQKIDKIPFAPFFDGIRKVVNGVYQHFKEYRTTETYMSVRVLAKRSDVCKKTSEKHLYGVFDPQNPKERKYGLVGTLLKLTIHGDLWNAHTYSIREETPEWDAFFACYEETKNPQNHPFQPPTAPPCVSNTVSYLGVEPEIFAKLPPQLGQIVRDFFNLLDQVLQTRVLSADHPPPG